MAVLVTGGAGYIGSHTCVELLNAGEDIIVIDNLCNSTRDTLDGIKEITGKDFKFYEVNLFEHRDVDKVFSENKITEVIHLAGRKFIPKSVRNPLLYYSTNVSGTLNLLVAMKKSGCSRFIYGSSMTVYGVPDRAPNRENAPLKPVNPYATTKLTVENICRELYSSNINQTMMMLRYPKVSGAHPSGIIGEYNPGDSNGLISLIVERLSTTRSPITVQGADFPTEDGSEIREYAHVMDIAAGNVAALKKLRSGTGFYTYNIGSGRGYSVFEIIRTFERVSGEKVEYTVGRLRSDAAPEIYSDSSAAQRDLGWKAERSLEEMCRDAWNYAEKHGKRIEVIG